MRTAIITGSTSGIGLGIATALAHAGCRIVLNGFGEPDEIERIRADIIAKSSAEVAYILADMRQPHEVVRMVAHVEARFGRVDILVNNAGIQFTAPIDEFPRERWDEIIAVNLSAAFHAIQAALPIMKRSGWGRVINIASAHGLVASANKCAYIAAKHGLVGLTKAAAIEAANTGVTINAICPGWVYTPLVEAQVQSRAESTGMPIEQAKMDLLAEKQPMAAFTTPEQVGALVVYLMGDAAQTITGAALSIDGGWTAQ